MSSGKSFKFQGTSISFLTGYALTSPAQAITGITKANPAVVTSNGHGHTQGDVVKLESVVGMTEVNNEVFIVGAVTTNTFELADTDSTGYGTYASGGTIDSATFSNFCELTNYNQQGGSSPEISTTSLCSTAAEYVIGLPDFGTTQVDYKFAPQTTIQLALQASHADSTKLAVKVVLPSDGGTMVQLGFIQQMNATAAVGGLWTGSITMRNTGPRYDFAS